MTDPPAVLLEGQNTNHSLVFLLQGRKRYVQTDDANTVIIQDERYPGGWICRVENGPCLFERAHSAQVRNQVDTPPEGSWRTIGRDTLSQYSLKHITFSPLTEEYLNQEKFRPWDEMLKDIKQTVGIPSGLYYDFGCGTGSMSKRLQGLSPKMRVVGFDLNPEMIAAAKQQCNECDFRRMNLANLDLEDTSLEKADGIWSAFLISYFHPDALESILSNWKSLLHPGGWICLVEINGLFSTHKSLDTKCSEYCSNLDFRMQKTGYDPFASQRLRKICEKVGLQILVEKKYEDRELYFNGQASSMQLEAWRKRLNRPGIKRLFYEEFSNRAEAASSEFLKCLESTSHTSSGFVSFMICRVP